MDKLKVLKLVNKICSMESTGCRSLNKSELARELLQIANVPEIAEIQEIPLDWNNQVVILFLIPNDVNYYSLFAGIGTDKEFHFELEICGQLEGKDFNFYDEDEVININYFKSYEMKITQEEARNIIMITTQEAMKTWNEMESKEGTRLDFINDFIKSLVSKNIMDLAE